MITKQSYDSLVTENRQLIDDENYRGYLDSKVRKSTVKVFIELGNSLSRLKGRLKEHSNKVASAHSIPIFNMYNDILKEIEILADDLAAERETGFYNITDLKLNTAYGLLKQDRELMQKYSDLKTFAAELDEKENISEKDINALKENFQTFKEVADRRNERIRGLHEMYKSQVEKVANIGHLIDQRNLEEATSVTESIFRDQEVFLEPCLDLAEHMRSRQLFHARRLEAGMHRDEQSLMFFDLYVNILSSLQNVMRLEADNIEHSPYKERAEQEVEKLENVKEKRDDLYSKASPRETATVDDDAETVAKSKIPVIATVAIIIVVILAVVLFVL